MNTRNRIHKLILLALSLALFAQVAVAGQPPRRGGGAPTPRTGKPDTQGDIKRVCIDLGVSKPIVRTIPYQRWPRNVVPTGKIVWMAVTVVVRNHSTTDLNEPFSVVIQALEPSGQTKPLWIETVRRGLRAGKSERLTLGFYYDFSNRPAQFHMRAAFDGTRRERNDCKEQNDLSAFISVDAARLADAAIGR